MSQQDRVPSANAETMASPTDDATEQPANVYPWFDPLPYLLPDRIGPFRPLRYMPVASRAWSYLLRYYRDQNKREPPGTKPYYCDRCKP
jgi:hypothetical protein